MVAAAIVALSAGDWVGLAGVLVAAAGIAVPFVWTLTRRRRQSDQAQSDQARDVHAWWERSPRPHEADRAEAVVDNDSRSPVFHANITVSSVRGGWRQKYDWPTVPPKSRVRFSVPAEAEAQAGAGAPTELRSGDHEVRLLFKDAQNRFWLREEGHLERLNPELLLWAEPRRAEMIRRQLERDFTGLYGITVRYGTGGARTGYQETVTELLDRFERAARGGTCPDVLLGPHDWVGRLAGRGLIEPLTLSERQRAAFSPDALAAMTYQGQLYGVPSTLDTVALIRNTDLAPEAPATVEELVAHGRALRADRADFRILALQVGEEGDAYHAWPLLSSAGLDLFGRHGDGSWDPGVVLPGAPEALAALRGLGDKGEQVLRQDVGDDTAMRLFLDRRTAFLVSASRALVDIAAVNDTLPAGGRLPFAVSPVPGFAGGRPGVPMVSAYGFYVHSAAPNKALARDLVGDYLARLDVAESIAGLQSRPSALMAAQDLAGLGEPVLAYTRECGRGDLMPSYPYMKEVWSALGEAERRVIGGADPARTAQSLVRAVTGHVHG
ncbi:extracellular solute-binding protein [Longispora sp. NPDC051575]|uniref:sugar ABC transporter substrate-binding protein n=1 Tax=Longispora sp. NPDC051575 TaxID=3154943 RepID=UPI00343D9EFE